MIDKNKIIEAYNYRHACKVFDVDKKISDEDFSFILETARLSPSSFGFEPWKFLIVQNMDLREKLKLVAWGAQGTLPTASHFIVILARKQKTMNYNSQYIKHMMQDVHHLPDDVIKVSKERYFDHKKEMFLKDDSLIDLLDFIDFYVGSWHWPAFNVADSALTVGIILFLFANLAHSHKKT